MKLVIATVGAALPMLASCSGRMPTIDETTAVVLRLRDYDEWAWALGIGLIWADLILPVPQTAIIAALGIVYGAVLGGLVGSFALITSGLLAYFLMRTPCGGSRRDSWVRVRWTRWAFSLSGLGHGQLF
jgi:uncharacterized membrane protein YdjX (TVP38/TMEM64 family)